MNIKLQLPGLMHLRPRITVVGVGGAGSNAVNNMIAAGLSGVNFVVANTDSQSLANSTAENRIQLGVSLTEGLGAGARPEIGRAAAEEAAEEIRNHIARSHMVFVAAGMGGGTGTGAAAVIARIAREEGALTVGVVTKPFQFEGTRRMRSAEAGIAALRPEVDTLIVIPNQNLFRIANERTTFADAFVLADQVLYSGIACVVDLIVKEGLINLDFADVRTIMSGMGTAMMGTGEAAGERRATAAAEEAISNPLLDDISLRGAKGLLVSITGGRDLTLYEVDEAATRVRQEVDPEANIIVGATFDDTLGDKVRVSIVASGMERLGETAEARSPQTTLAASLPLRIEQPAQPAAIDTQPPFIEPYPQVYSDQEPREPQAQPQQTRMPPPVPPSQQPSLHPAPTAYTEAQQRAETGWRQASPVYGGGQLPETPMVSSRPADSDVTRALSAALGHRDQSPAYPDEPAHQANASQQRYWTSPDGATFHDAPPQSPSWMPQPVDPVTSPRQHHADLPAYGMQSQVDPAPGGRRLPQVEDFPLVGQREYHAKAAQYANAPAPPKAYGHAAPEPAPRRGLLARLFGRRKTEQKLPAAADGYQQAARPSGASDVDLEMSQRNKAPLSQKSSASGGAQEYDLPVFFGSGKK